MASGCADGDGGAVGARVDIFDRTTNSITAGAVTALTGTYGGLCHGHAEEGTDPWTFTVGEGGLSVTKNDADCVLTITSIVTGAGTFTGTPTIPLNTEDAYKTTASAFANGAQVLPFYANAKISALSYAANFTITVLLAETASSAGSRTATYATQGGTVAAGTVPPPNYSIGLGSFNVVKDAANLVDSVSGFAQLTAGSNTGESYAIHEGPLDGTSTLQQVETAFAGADTTGELSDLTTLQLPASGFGLAGEDLDDNPQRTVIISRTVSGVSSYQLFLITFTP